MADTKVLTLDGAVIYRAGKLINGVSGVGTTGARAPETDTTTLISGKRTHILDVADPGTITFTMNFNPSDKVHKEMYETLGSESLASYEMITQGKIVNDVATKTGKQLAGDLYSTTIALADNVAKMTVNASKTTTVFPSSGDYLDDQRAANAEDLIVEEIDYSVQDQVKVVVVKAADGTAASAEAGEQHYKLVTPAMSRTFQAFVQEMSEPSTGRAGVLTSAVALRISGPVTWHIGSPDIA